MPDGILPSALKSSGKIIHHLALIIHFAAIRIATPL